MTLRDDELAAIRARCAAAAPGPWRAVFAECGGYDCMTNAHNISSETGEIAVIDHALGGSIEEDAAFIAASRTDVPRLLDCIERVAAKNAILEGVVTVARRVAEAQRVLDLSLQNQNADGLPYRPYQWEYARELAEGAVADAIQALVEALGDA